MQRGENLASQQAAIFRSYNIAKHACGIFSRGSNVVAPNSGFSTEHPPLGVVFAYPHRQQRDAGSVVMYQDLRGCKANEPFAVVGINQGRLDFQSGGHAGREGQSHSRVQLFGTSEVRLNKNAPVFTAGEIAYVRFPTDREITTEMTEGKYPLSLIVCKQSPGPGSQSVAELLTNGSSPEGKGKATTAMSTLDTTDDDAVHKFMKGVLERTIFADSYLDQSQRYTLADAYAELVDKNRAWADRGELLRLIVELERNTQYSRHRRLGKVLKSTRQGSSKLLVFLDP